MVRCGALTRRRRQLQRAALEHIASNAQGSSPVWLTTSGVIATNCAV
jgi:hypothetical protein